MARLDRGNQPQDTQRMTRILVINPNCTTACSDGIDAAIAPFRFPGGPSIDVVTTADGPPAVYSTGITATISSTT